MLQRPEISTPPVVGLPGVGVGPSVAPSSYLLHRNRRDLSYKGLVDPVNARLTIKQADYRDAGLFSADVLRAARSHDMSKLLVYAPAGRWRELMAWGFVLEGILDGFFAGEPAYIMGYLLTGARKAYGDVEREQSVLEAALAVAPEPPPALDPIYQLLSCGPEMAEALAAVYHETFTTFPTPMHDPAFVARLINSGDGIFVAALHGGRIASVAAVEVDRHFGAAEATNCATLPPYRGEGLMQILLRELEQEMERQRVPTLFSLARAYSFGMNRALRKAGYSFGGRLLANSHIMGSYEDMNLWVRRRAAAPT